MEYLPTIIICVVLAGIVVLAVISVIKDKKMGKGCSCGCSGCSCGCSGCSMSGSCPSAKKSNESQTGNTK